MMKVRDWMTRGFVGVPSDFRVVDALTTMLRFHLNGLPVVDDQQRLLGIVTLSDVRRRLLPRQQDLVDHEYYLHRPELIEERLQEVAELPVADVMTRQVITVDPEDPVLAAGALMSARRVRQIPVVEKGKVVGLITPHDIAWGFLACARRRA